MCYKRLIFFLFFIFLSFIFGLDDRLIVTIPKQDGISLKIPSLGLKVGESGIITRVSNNNEFIIANATVDKIEDEIATLSYSKFDAISQEYMPKPLGTPMEGDKVIFRILYNRALIIVPNQNLYKIVVDNNSDIDFVHADVFASFLASNKFNMPTKDNFTKFCNKFGVGLIFMWHIDSLFTLDCNSLKVLNKRVFNDVNVDSTDIKLPFFTRLSNEALNELFNIKKLQDYNEYYNQFVNIK